MKPQCAAAVNQAAQALGREGLTDGELKAIESRLASTMRQLARTEPEWRGMSRDMRVSLAAERAMRDIHEEAARKVANVQRQIIATAATEQRIGEAMKSLGENRTHALVHDMDLTHGYISGIKQESMGRLVSLMDAVKSGEGATAGRRVMQFLFDADNPHMTRDLANEIFGGGDGRTGNKAAQEGAKAFLDVIEGMRERFNAAGGDVGRLDYGYIPQPHDAARVRGKGDAAARDAWVAKILPQLDRERYVDETGTRMSDAQVQEVMRGAWETIGTEGLNKQEPGSTKGSGARANRGSDSRQIHFKDGDAYLAYMRDFGTGSMYDAIVSHIGRQARDIGLVERYGPNPNAQLRLQFDLSERADNGVQRVFGMRPQVYADLLTGVASSPQSARIAQVGTDVRNIQTMGKLAGAVITSITDMGTFIIGTGYNRLSYWDAFRNIGRQASPEVRRFLTAHGIIAESMIGDMNRWTGDNIKQTWSGRLAQSTLKLSLMNLWTDSTRRAFSLTMMQGMARLAGKDWEALTQWDRALMERRGLTAADWGVIRKAELTDFLGAQHLTPESIRATGHARANEVVAKVLGLIQDESEFAVLNPDMATKGLSSGGAMQRGTVRGELARSVMQFKSFPLAMVSRHWRRMMDAPTVTDGSAPLLANRVVYGGAMLLTTTALGAIALQTKQVVTGKDPIDMTGEHAAKFWAKAVAQGGGLSIVGDMILNDPGNATSDAVRGIVGTMAGPAVSTAAQGAAIAIENAWKAAKGKTTHAAAETMNWARQNAPYVNLWYAKAALDHAGLHALQENLSPGYLGKMQQSAKKDWGQDYWWKPGTGGPERAPDIGKAVGQ